MNNQKRKEKIVGLLIFLVFYLVSYVIGFFVGNLLEDIRLKLFVFDIVATFLIYLLSLPIKNSSLYDAYWSLTPFVMVTYLLVHYFDSLNVYHFLVYAAFSIWSFRLTINWIITFDNIHWVDWRYRELKENNNKVVWQIINFFGIMLVPTLFVFAGFYPLIEVFQNPIGPWSLLGVAILLLGTILELVADHQMHHFLKENKDHRDVIQEGLWKYSSHPNYLGEISVWVGVYLTLFPSILDGWYLFGGIVLMLILFNFISIPLAEKRQLKRRPAYAEYRRTTSRLLLLPRRKKPSSQ